MVPPTCSDGIQNGDETGVDCGGSCTACPVEPTCSDGVQNGDETGVDCGGSCTACPVTPTCSDGIKNQDETGVDTGGVCGITPTCSDGVQNGDETGVDCGGSCGECSKICNANGIQDNGESGVDCGGGNCPACPKECKINECSSQSITNFSSCQSQAAQGNGSYAECAANYCDQIRSCYQACGMLDATEQHTFVVSPNGGESYNINDNVPVRWYYTARDKKSKVTYNNLPLRMSISTDGGQSYTPIKTLVPADNPNSAYVTQYRASEAALNIGTYRSVQGSFDLEYSWIPGDAAYVSDSVRIKLEPYLYNCVIQMNSDASDNNFKLTADTNNGIFLKIRPTLAKVLPGSETTFEVSAFLADGSDVTSSTSFSYLVSDTSIIKSSNANKVTLEANNKKGIFDRALQVTANRNGQEAIIYGGLEIYTPGDPKTPENCTGFCRLVDFIKKTVKGMGASADAENSLALFSAIVALFNLALNSFSLFRNVIAPLIKGKEKHKAKSLVYDAVTGAPIADAQVMLVSPELKTLASMSLSDKEGKYNLEVSPDKQYLIKAEKDGYSQFYGQGNQLDRNGLIYSDNYLGGEFKTLSDQYVFDRNIPLLETNPGNKAKDLWRKAKISQILVALNVSLLLLGSGTALVVFIAFPTAINYVILGIYMLILGYHLVNRFVISGKSYGTVINTSQKMLKDQAVDLAIIRAVRVSDQKLAKTVVSDIKGRFTLTLPKGKYVLFASKEGLHQIEHLEVQIKSSFAPRHDTIKMQEVADSDKTKTYEDRPSQDLPSSNSSGKIANQSANSADEIIAGYKPDK